MTKPKNRRVRLADGRVVTLTPAQVRAVKAVAKHSRLHAYNGVSRATIAVLERLGLVTVEWKTVMVETSHGYRGVWRQRPQLDWTARLNPAPFGR